MLQGTADVLQAGMPAPGDKERLRRRGPPCSASTAARRSTTRRTTSAPSPSPAPSATTCTESPAPSRPTARSRGARASASRTRRRRPGASGAAAGSDRHRRSLPRRAACVAHRRYSSRLMAPPSRGQSYADMHGRKQYCIFPCRRRERRRFLLLAGVSVALRGLGQCPKRRRGARGRL